VLVWSESFTSREDAFAAERRIKGWSRVKKEALIRGDFAAIQRLAKRISRASFDTALQPSQARLQHLLRMSGLGEIRNTRANPTIPRSS